jgi:hypothetical protein
MGRLEEWSKTSQTTPPIGDIEGGKEGWEQVIARYVQGFKDFAELSRRTNKGVTINETPQAVKKLAKELPLEDLIAIKEFIRVVEEESSRTEAKSN